MKFAVDQTELRAIRARNDRVDGSVVSVEALTAFVVASDFVALRMGVGDLRRRDSQCVRVPTLRLDYECRLHVVRAIRVRGGREIRSVRGTPAYPKTQLLARA